MDERIQQALDGELPRSALTAAEQAALRAAEGQISAILRAMPARALPDLAPGVMARIEASAGRRPADAHPAATQPGWLDWLWRPRPLALSWRPAYGIAAAALCVVAFALGRNSAPAATGVHPVLTEFRLVAPDAQQVSLAGDFTDWQPAHAMTASGAGVWTVVVPLAPGVHSYAFVVDGEQWLPDPNAPAVDDGFGGLNSRLAVLAPDDLE